MENTIIDTVNAMNNMFEQCDEKCMFCYLIIVIPMGFFCIRERRLATANKQVTDAEFSK